MRRAAFVRRQNEIRWHITREIPSECDAALRGTGPEDLKEELVEGQVTPPDDLLAFLDATEI